MIISVSRRSDIPAFFSEWFFNRLEAGFLYTQNPMNRKQVSRINLSPNVVDCIVFWTKNPKPMLDKLHLLKGYNYYFQFTLTSYDKSIEPSVPRKSELIETFKKLSDKIGPDRVIWRYDPIFYSDHFDYNYHHKYFGELAQKLKGYTNKCIISFFDEYRKCEKNMRNVGYYQIKPDEMKHIANEFALIGKQHGITIETCAEDVELDAVGVKHGKCIDDELISHISDREIDVSKDKNQRLLCGCVASIDVGAYDTCPHNCLYCYANVNKDQVAKNYKEHDPMSPLLKGNLQGDEKISERKMKSLFELEQMSFL